ncbi:MAG: aspartate kinase, partial [Bacteroidota bacterium]
AMGKTTNQLEKVHLDRIQRKNWEHAFEVVKDFHEEVADGLGLTDNELTDFHEEIGNLATLLKQPVSGDENFDYDRVVSYGEILSTLIIAAFFEKEGFNSEWMDIRNVIKTNNQHRSADIDWHRSQRSADVLLSHLEEDPSRIIITQGFIAQSKLGNTTTLGREGSDFSAAILANLTEAAEAVIWKDVPGMLNADPKWFSNTIHIPHISYSECIELSYYGASVIHTKTIQPLQQKGIPLLVKSFNDPEAKGTLINETTEYDALVPMYIFKPDQVLLSIRSRNLSFVVEKHLSDIFEMIARTGLNVNVMQNSAISFSICVDKDDHRIKQLRDMLHESYEVRYNEGLELLTMRHYDQGVVNKLTKDKEVLMEQRSRQTLRLILR